MKCPICKSEKMCVCKWFGVIVIILIVVGGGYFLLKGSYRAPALTPTAPIPTVPAPITSPSGEEGVTPTLPAREITVSGTEFSFNPASITVSAGERVRVTFRNDGAIPHNFTIAELGVATNTIGGGNTDTIEFTAPSSGTLTFFCAVSGHRARGMKGELNVQ